MLNLFLIIGTKWKWNDAPLQHAHIYSQVKYEQYAVGWHM